MNNDSDKLLGCLSLIVLGIVMEIVSALLNGWVLSLMWAWFIVPLGVVPIRRVHALGVGVLVSLLTSPGKRSKDERTSQEQFSDAVAHALVTPLIYLVMGWIVQRFM